MFGIYLGRLEGRGVSLPINAHRVSWEIFYGPIGGLHVLHICDNPPCVNPEHLFLGTSKDNTHDAWRKGKFDNRVISFEDAEEIRKRYVPRKNGGMRALASKFGINRNSVCSIIHRGIYTEAIPGMED